MRGGGAFFFLLPFPACVGFMGGQEKRKDRKTRKGFSSASLLHARKRETVTQGGIMLLEG